MSHHGIDVQLHRDPGDFLDQDRDLASQATCLLIDSAIEAPGPVDLVQALRLRGCGTPIIVMVDSECSATATAVLDAGATDVIAFPLVYAYLMNRLGDFDNGVGYAQAHVLAVRGGTEVTFRFMQPGDAEMEQAFIRGLSETSRYMRFFTLFKELPPRLLDVFTHNSFPRSYAVIATLRAGEEETQIGVARYAPTEEDGTAEFAVVVADEWQGYGVATRLMRIIIIVAAMAGYARLDGLILRENTAMLSLSHKLGFQTVRGFPDGPSLVRVRKQLDGRPAEPQGEG